MPERRPVCGPCSTRSRDCVYPECPDAPSSHTSVDDSVPGDQTWLDDQDSLRPALELPSPHTVVPDIQASLCSNDLPLLNAASQPVPVSTWSPDSAFWTTDFASTRWLDLLANDAAQADSGFSLAPTPALRTGEERPPDIGSLQARLSQVAEAERTTWQDGARPTVLSSREAGLLRHFAESCALWLDLFNPQRLFSTYVIRLALKDAGLMNAILALSARHHSRRPHPNDPNTPDVTDNESIRHYYETLHYVQEALPYTSYTNSEELLATAIIISAYEMLDESDGRGNWQRHLKGVFWIQRSQNVNGSSGGLRQAVWWAWLRQDVWAAFREKRSCFSFWVPMQELGELDQHGMADRAIYLLSQAVNYYANSHAASSDTAQRPRQTDLSHARVGLLQKIEELKSRLGEHYQPLPVPSETSELFQNIWIHPPEIGAALQALTFALILITLHSPIPAGFNGYLRMQKTLTEAVNTICGIAMELKDEGCQILSAQCLYGAGLCLQDTAKREKVIQLMEACESRVSWAPMKMWRDDLRMEWAKADQEDSQPV
ncbi:hypothetical protein FGSG_08043 [Fusarium graminearum PH-1]|uniref:Chromosome 2, complete genome n=1 Tax=Gibberella zeae (strain ATCC MYA-4620 / CBS 123657 / FGSC 9075 / NRRL 31084 / PH-1) TaxID=229533 RepID=I1RUY4_GIBZE|nr:hypothetical protein FGSG_08043 [Fusarium graminearum PH-1]ESU15356.1 hypothetical protein FGSG_08043 [Fusarium graminearum PH-1]EYB25102.1 hypothetical protein FG05_08043 [Fusarium graminearum]CAF3559778.1 unnamed protein product [Fusarium graminearum]CEF76295.1 unnamed protein product [Fusarium graminearum]|eukprot:XP_011320781.1 hypothetical protein FGSG_08043 [Fusarium graminearum PH-1]